MGAKDDKKVKEAAEQGRFLTFRLQEEEYGLDVLKAREVLKFVPVTRIPSCPPFVCGVINLRGSVVLVLNLEQRIYRKPRDKVGYTRIIVADGGAGQTGLAVDCVLDLVSLPPRGIGKLSARLRRKLRAEYVEGEAKLGSRSVIVLNPGKITSSAVSGYPRRARGARK